MYCNFPTSNTHQYSTVVLCANSLANAIYTKMHAYLYKGIVGCVDVYSASPTMFIIYDPPTCYHVSSAHTFQGSLKLCVMLRR